MTINSETAEVSITGNGSQTVFSYTFLIPYQADGETPAVAVSVLTLATGESVLLDPEDYTIDGVGDSAGGTVEYPLVGDPLLNDQALVIARALEVVQPYAVLNQSFLPNVIEQIADRITMELQQFVAPLVRAILVPVGEQGLLLPSAESRANNIFEFTSSGAAMASRGVSDIVQLVLDALGQPFGSPQFLVLSGAGFPSNDLGTDHDFYLQNDVTPTVLWGPKEDGTWPFLRFEINWTPITTVPMPQGALWILDVNEYDEDLAVIPNTLATSDPDVNVFRAPNYFFDVLMYFASTGGVTTVQQADGSATSVMTVGTHFIGHGATANMPAGDYTIGITTKRNTGSDQDFNLGATGIGVSSTMTATSAYQEFSYTFNLAAPGMPLLWIAGVVGLPAGANLQIKNARLTPGVVDVIPGEVDGHCYMGATIYDALNAGLYSSGKLNLGNSGFGLIQMPDAVTLDTFSVTVLAKKLYASITGTNPRGDYQFILSKAEGVGTAWEDFSPAYEFGTGNKGIKSDFSSLDSAKWELFAGAPQTLLGEEYHSYTHRYDGDWFDLFFDGLLFCSYPVAGLGPVDVQNLYLNMIIASNLTSSYGIAGQVAMWDRAITDDEAYVAFASNEASADPTAIVSAPTKVWTAWGDSITGSFDYSYPYVNIPNIPETVYLSKQAQTSLFLQDMIDRLPKLEVLALQCSQRDIELYFTVFIGANNTAAIIADPTGFAADLADYLTTVKALTGIGRVGVMTVLPRVQTPGVLVAWPAFDAARLTLNTAIRAYGSDVCDDIIDFGGSATLGQSTDVTDAAKYPDGLHPSAASHVTLAGIVQTYLDSYFS